MDGTATVSGIMPAAFLGHGSQHSGRPPQILLDGYALGSLSMTSYTLDCGAVTSDSTQPPVAPPMPDPSVVPPDQTNI